MEMEEITSLYVNIDQLCLLFPSKKKSISRPKNGAEMIWQSNPLSWKKRDFEGVNIELGERIEVGFFRD